MTIQEDYNQFVKEHGCRGHRCNDCLNAFARNPKEGTFKCIIVELAKAAGVNESP